METLFSKLVPNSSQEDFERAVQGNRSFCLHNLMQTNETFKNINFLKNFESLFKNWKLEVDVHLPESRDEQTTQTLSSVREAKTEFEKGQSLLFNDVNRQEPQLEAWLEDIRKSLKLSVHTFSRCLVYATPEGGGNAPHFDQNINFVLQVHGEKTWWTAPNSSVTNPIHRHVIGHEADPELETYAEEMPLKFPEDKAEAFHLKPGSLLFVPPGVWHKTKSSSDALSLNFTFSPPTWTDLITMALRGRLMQSEIWREIAKDLTSSDQIEKLDFLIQHLASDVSTWKAKELVEAIENQM